MGRHRRTKRRHGGIHRQEAREKPKWERTSPAPPMPSLYLGLHLQGWEGPGTPGSWWREELGFSPMRGCPPPLPGANQRLSSPR